MEKVYIQINFKGTDWDSVPVVEEEFETRSKSVDFTKRLSRVLKCNVRASYPQSTFTSIDKKEIQQYAGRLSGSYFNP